MPTRSDKPSTRKSASRKTKPATPVDPAARRAPNAAESAPETLVPDVVRTDLTREVVSSETDRGRWIEQRAYELAQARGFAPGAQLDDWLQAEREYDAKTRDQTRPENQFTG